MLIDQSVRIPAFYGIYPVTPLVRQPVNGFALNVILQKGAFPTTAAAIQKIAMDIKHAQAIFDANANANPACPRIKLVYDPRRDLRDAASAAPNPPGGILEVFLLLSHMGGWKQWQSGLPCINLYYLKDLPDTPGGTTTGGHIPGALTVCNQRTVQIMNKMLAELADAIQSANGNMEPSELQDFTDTVAQIRYRPSIYLDVKRGKGPTLAHEIAHILGLPHHPDRSNLMFPAANLRTGSNLTTEQGACLVAGIEQYSTGQFPFK